MSDSALLVDVYQAFIIWYDVSIPTIVLLLLQLLVLTAIDLLLLDSSPYTSPKKKIRINIHKRNNKKNSISNSIHSIYKST